MDNLPFVSPALRGDCGFVPELTTSDNGCHVTIKEYVQDIIRSEGALRSAQLQSTERALDLAKIEIDRRLHSMNQMREQIQSERGQSVQKEWFERIHGMATIRLDILENWRSTMEGKILGSETKIQNRMLIFGVIVTLLNLIIAAVAVFISLHREGGSLNL